MLSQGLLTFVSPSDFPLVGEMFVLPRAGVKLLETTAAS